MMESEDVLWGIRPFICLFRALHHFSWVIPSVPRHFIVSYLKNNFGSIPLQLPWSPVSFFLLTILRRNCRLSAFSHRFYTTLIWLSNPDNLLWNLKACPVLMLPSPGPHMIPFSPRPAPHFPPLPALHHLLIFPVTLRYIHYVCFSSSSLCILSQIINFF